MKREELLIVVPARSGSKGLPGKNTRSLGGIPLLGWTAEAVRLSGLAEYATVVLSTEDPEIAAIGASVGLTPFFRRPAELATDTASTVDVTLHCLSWFETERGTAYRSVMLLQPTSPFRPPSILATAWDTFKRADQDGVLGVTPIYRSLSTLFKTDKDGRLMPASDAVSPTRRQEIDPLYTPNGALYLVAVAALRNERSFFPSRLVGLAMDSIASIDIDDATDWALAEAVVNGGLTWRQLREAPGKAALAGKR